MTDFLNRRVFSLAARLPELLRAWRPGALLYLLVATVYPGQLSMGAQTAVSVPPYVSGAKLSGVIRTRGSKEAGQLMKYWEAGFRKFHPGVSFEDTLNGSESAMLGLEESVADIALMSRQIVPYDTYGVWRRSHHSPLEFEIASGSYDAPEKTPAIAVFVHKENPLAKLTLKQLDGIFGAARTGGWQGMEWHTEISRGPEGDLRTWGQLGLTGKWKYRPIHTYGPPGLYPGGMSYFQIRVMGGADTWAESLREFADPVEMMKAFDNDPLAIVYAGAAFATPNSKSVALSEGGGPFVTLTRAHVRDRTYPLSRSIYLYIAPDSPAGDLQPPSPLLKEFLLYIFSRQGQEDVLRQADYFPLPWDRLLAERTRVSALSDAHHD